MVFENLNIQCCIKGLHFVPLQCCWSNVIAAENCTKLRKERICRSIWDRLWKKKKKCKVWHDVKSGGNSSCSWSTRVWQCHLIKASTSSASVYPPAVAAQTVPPTGHFRERELQRCSHSSSNRWFEGGWFHLHNWPIAWQNQTAEMWLRPVERRTAGRSGWLERMCQFTGAGRPSELQETLMRLCNQIS